jgi:hypothetical protein
MEVKLAAIQAIGERVADSWSSSAGYDYLRQAYRDLVPIAAEEDYPELSRAASNMIRSMELRYGERASATTGPK